MSISSTVLATLSFADLQQMSIAQVDDLPFGVVGVSREGLAEIYNATESRLAGIPREAVLGRAFFVEVAQCMNNFMVAERLKEEGDLDVTLPYMLTFRMRPTPVVLRLLKSTASSLAYVLIQR